MCSFMIISTMKVPAGTEQTIKTARSEVKYCHLVWHNCRSSDSRKIERIQERALRAVFNSHSESYENLLVRAELPSLLNRRLQDIAILMYKVKYGLAPSIVNELFKRKSTSYSLRNSDFDIPTFNTINYGKHSLRYQGPHIWSKLDNKLKGSSNIESFKKNIRKKDLTSLLNNNSSCCNLCNSQKLLFIYQLFYYIIYTCYIF